MFRVSVSKKGISAIALSREYALNYKTAYNFKRKIQRSMRSSLNNPLRGIIHVDEFTYGGEEEGCQGRSNKSRKLKVCNAMEVIDEGNDTEPQIGRAYALKIEDYSSKSLKQIFEQHISKSAQIKTDKWSGYTPMGKNYNLEQDYSNKGKNFPQIHNLIMNIKSWIRGIHHSISNNKAQLYLDEFFYRFNRRNYIDKLPIFALKSMMNTKPCPVIATKGGYYG